MFKNKYMLNNDYKSIQLQSLPHKQNNNIKTYKIKI